MLKANNRPASVRFVLASICLCLSLMIFSMNALPVLAQSEASKGVGTVTVDGAELFSVHGSLGKVSVDQRAKNITKRIKRLLDDPEFAPQDISVIETEGQTEIVAGETVITEVTDADALSAGLTKAQLAEEVVGNLKSKLPAHFARRSVQDVIEDASVENFSRGFLQILFEPMTLKVGMALFGVLFISIVVAFFRRSVGRYITDSNKRYASKKIVDLIGGFAALVFITVVFRDTLGNLAVIVGAATAGIAFALKEVIVSIAGWVAVTFGDFYDVGDRIQLGGIKGDVIDVGFGRTTLMELGEWVNGDLYTGRIVRVSNSFVFSQPFFNYSGDFPFLWDECTVPVKYGCDHKLVRCALENIAERVSEEFIEQAETHWRRIAQKYLVEDARTSPMVTIALNDNWMEFTVRYVVDYRRRRVSKDKLFTLLLDEIERSEGKIQLASATFQLVETPVFDVNISRRPASVN